MSKLEKYKTYKDSGVEWLGEVPEHWEILKAKYFHKNLKALNTKRICDNVLSLTLRGVVNNNIDSPEGLVPKDYATYQIFEKDDLVFKLIDLENISTSRVGIVHEKGIMSSAYIRLKTGQNTIPRFAYYYYYSLYINQVYNNIGSGVRSTLGPNDLLNIDYIEPPIDEQSQIVSFLDKKTSQIDSVISQKEKLIELLKEQKQITINEAVTKGLDKDVEFKDSGVEWIGEIPKHWNIEKGKRLFKQMKRPVREEDEIVTCFRDGVVTLRSNRRTEGFTNALKEHGYQGIRKGDFIIHNMDAFAGAIGISDSDGKSTPVYAVCRPWDDNLVSSEFYAKYLRNLALQDFILSLAKGIRERSTDFRFKDFGELVYPVPPKDEQVKIVEYIETQTAKIDKAIELQQNYIAKLKEYKASLIDSVVTGKVRVA